MREDRGQVIAGGRFSIGFGTRRAVLSCVFRSDPGLLWPIRQRRGRNFLCPDTKAISGSNTRPGSLGGREHMGEALVWHRGVQQVVAAGCNFAEARADGDQQITFLHRLIQKFRAPRRRNVQHNLHDRCLSAPDSGTRRPRGRFCASAKRSSAAIALCSPAATTCDDHRDALPRTVGPAAPQARRARVESEVPRSGAAGVGWAGPHRANLRAVTGLRVRGGPTWRCDRRG